MAKIGIIGAGAFGTAVGNVVASNGHTTILWSYEQEVADQINQQHINQKYLPDIPLHQHLVATTSLAQAVEDADAVIFIPPSQYTLELAQKISPLLSPLDPPIIACMSKGFAIKDGKPWLLLDAIESQLPEWYYRQSVYITGPTHAKELASGVYSGMVAASFTKQAAVHMQKLLSNTHLKITISDDVLGVQMMAATKNIMAIIHGIVDGIAQTEKSIGDNTQSIIYAQGLTEIYELTAALCQTQIKTCLGPAGAGDLLVTATSHHGRNRRFGYELVSLQLLETYGTLENVLQKITYLPEGAYALRAIMSLENRPQLPLMQTLWDILQKKKTPKEAIVSYLAGL
ncbi:MAG: NAD(P)H-dependent glycerol-3-phosphate dehydrogenase [Candidatus Woesearchaeota archaeon]